MHTPRTFRNCNTDLLVRQIDAYTLAATSGGRVIHRDTGITLPINEEWSVTVDLASSDTYVVRRVRQAPDGVEIKDERTYVNAFDLDAYISAAECFQHPVDELLGWYLNR